MSINVRRPPLSGRHLLAAEKSLTKFAISLGEGARTAPRAPTRKTGVCKAPPPAKARARQPPHQEQPQLRGPPPPPPCPRAHSRARARTLTPVHTTKGSGASRVRSFARALREAPPPGPPAPPRACSLAGAPPEGPRVRGSLRLESHRPGPPPLRSAALAGSCGGSGPTMRAAPPAAGPRSGEMPRGRAWAPYIPVFLIKLLQGIILGKSPLHTEPLSKAVFNTTFLTINLFQ